MYRCATKAGTTSYMAIPSVFMTATSRYWHRWKPDLSTNSGLMLSLFPPPIQKTDKGTADGGLFKNKSIRNGRKEFRFLEHLCPLSKI